VHQSQAPAVQIALHYCLELRVDPRGKSGGHGKTNPGSAAPRVEDWGRSAVRNRMDSDSETVSALSLKCLSRAAQGGGEGCTAFLEMAMHNKSLELFA